MKKILYAFAIAAFCLAANAADMPKAGTPAPAFTLPGQDGKDVSLSDYRGKWVVLYFYPKDFTGGCTLEAHNFQADSPKYAAKNAVIIGVSVDTVDSHKSFCTKQGLGFKLLSDAKHQVSDLYGSVMGYMGQVLAARNTFIIGPDGVIRKTYSKVNPVTHSKDALADLDLLQSAEKQ